MTPAEDAAARKLDRLAETKPNGDTKLRSDVFGLDNATLGPLLLHEFSHTGQNTNYGGIFDFDEGQSYAIEYYYAERTGDKARMAKILSIISSGAIVLPAQRAALKENFQISYAMMTALRDLTASGSSALPPLAGLNGSDGRVVAAEFVSSSGTGKLTDRVQSLWDYGQANMAAFTTPTLP